MTWSSRSSTLGLSDAQFGYGHEGGCASNRTALNEQPGPHRQGVSTRAWPSGECRSLSLV